MPPDQAAPDMIPSPRPPSFRKRIRQAGSWSISGYALSQSVRLAGNLAAARLLAPEMFGIVAIANLLVLSLTLLSDLGLRRNILQSSRSGDPGFLDTAWTVQIFRGILLGAAALLLAGLLHGAQLTGAAGPAMAWGDPRLPLAIALVAFSAPIAGFQSIRVATAVHRHQQTRLVGMELAGQAAGIAVTLAWAWVAPSLWALVAGNLAAVLVSTLASHRLLAGPPHRLAWDGEALPELLGMGRWVLASSAIGVLAVAADRLFLGAVVDGRLLGIYTIGQFIVAALENGVARLFFTVSMPAMGEAQFRSPAELGALHYGLLAPFDFFLFFAAGFLFAGGGQLVALLYDPRYAEAGAVLAILALGLPSLRFALASQVYLALGQPHLAARISGARLVALALLLPAGFWLGGFTGAVWAAALHGFAAAPLALHYNRRLGIADFRREFRALPCLPLGLALGWLAGPGLASLGLAARATTGVPA